ncbi:hypothetical protein D3C79_519330 [compost metagenome]
MVDDLLRGARRKVIERIDQHGLICAGDPLQALDLSLEFSAAEVREASVEVEALTHVQQTSGGCAMLYPQAANLLGRVSADSQKIVDVGSRHIGERTTFQTVHQRSRIALDVRNIGLTPQFDPVALEPGHQAVDE